MRNLFDLDLKDYDEKGPMHCRHSVRGIIIRDGKIAMDYVQKHGCYKFPGGGSEGNETKIETLGPESVDLQPNRNSATVQQLLTSS